MGNKMDMEKAARRWENPQDADPDEDFNVVTLQDAWGEQLFRMRCYKNAISYANERGEYTVRAVTAFVIGIPATPSNFWFMDWIGPDANNWLVLLAIVWMMGSMLITFSGGACLFERHERVKMKERIPAHHEKWENAMIAQMNAEQDCTSEEMMRAYELGPLHPQEWDMRMF